MNIKEKIDEVIKEKKELKKKFNTIKNEYQQHITNKEIPILERWEFYLNAPAELKEQSRTLINPKTKFLKYVNDNWFDAPEIYGRGKIIYIDQLFDDIIWKGKIYLENLNTTEISEDDVKTGLEELLKMNLEYFTYDW